VVPADEHRTDEAVDIAGERGFLGVEGLRRQRAGEHPAERGAGAGADQRRREQEDTKERERPLEVAPAPQSPLALFHRRNIGRAGRSD
jgi:hypothetical protein